MGKYELESWFLQGGGTLHASAEIALDSTGLFVRACKGQDILPGSCIVSCPHELTLSWLNAIEGSDPFVDSFNLSSASRFLNKTVITRFFLIKQFQLHEKSYWWPYIHSLPQPDSSDRLSTPMWYDFDDLVWIRGTNLEYAMKMKEQLWRQEYEEALSLLIIGSSNARELYSWRLYKWAATIFSSRSFPSSAVAHQLIAQDDTKYNYPNKDSFHALHESSSSKWPVLIPGLDLLNHIPSAKVTWNWGRLVCSITVDELVTGSSQIWNNYGPKNNEELIMGYGFTHFRNSADVCNLAVSPDLKERIKTIEAQKRSLMTVVRPDVDLEKDSSFQTSLMVHSNQAMHWVRLKNPDIRLRHHPRSPTYEFSRHFLKECSLAFSNKREVAEADFSFQFCEDFLDSPLSRNKLHVMCSVTMMLQRQLAAIAKHDEDLPPWPQNDRQFHAARYRRTQLRILSSVVKSLIGELRMIKGVGSPTKGNIRAVRLEYILLDSPQGLLIDFRSVLNSILGTRNPYKIRKHGWVECAFTVWLCGLFLWDLRNGPIGSACSEFSANIPKWLNFLRRVYGEPFIVNTSQQKLMELHGQNKNDELTITHPETDLYDNDIDERLSLVQSYLAAIITAVKKNPTSLFGDSEVTIPNLMWCLNVVREEGVMCPNLEGKVDEENDEFILYMDNDEEG